MQKWENAMRMAINAAEQFLGATAPNPPVGAIALDKNGKVLLGAGHQGAGLPHAEAKVLDMAERLGKLRAIETLVVTLEPCNHQGRTPPCTEAILRHKNIRRVVIGARDPNPIAQGGAEVLRAKGIEVIEGVLERECRALIRAFTKFVTKKVPYVTLKSAWRNGTMIPPPGQKTFTSPEALNFAHRLRKRADAIWTGSGTVLTDSPELTVRHVPDHPAKKRVLVLSDRRRRVPQDWITRAEKNGFELLWAETLEEGLQELAKRGILEVLVEAGPTLLDALLKSGLWDEHVIISQDAEKESIKIETRE